MYILTKNIHITDKCTYSLNIYIYHNTVETYQYNLICKYNEQTTLRKNMQI
jgi:hypothetical protein